MTKTEYLSNEELVDEFILSTLRYEKYRVVELREEILRRLNEPWRRPKND